MSIRNSALDHLRGLAVFLMILVNLPGSWGNMYSPLKHAKWDGITVADIVFPIFLWVVGYSILLSFQKNQIQTNNNYTLKIFYRSFILIGLGIFLSLFPKFDFEHFRIPGVLQRIGFCYFIFAMSLKYFGVKKTFYWIISISILISIINVHWNYAFSHFSFIPIPIKDTIGAKLDRFLFGEHLWNETKFYDPEGFITSISALLSVSLGAFAAYQESQKNSIYRIIWKFIFYLAVGFVLYLEFPPNKTNWNLTFVFLTTCVIELMYLFFQSCSKVDSLNLLNQLWKFLFLDLSQYALSLFLIYGIITRTTHFILLRKEIVSILSTALQNPNLASLFFSIMMFIWTLIFLKIWKDLRKIVSPKS
ncbi:MAG: hypothetical protein SH817_15270 [Leptospira sp.]|nr:hypothetical protein [Leptospira sp.]